MNFKNLAQPWMDSPQAAAHLPIRPNAPFYFMHHAKNWEIAMFTTKKRVPNEKGKRETKDVLTPLWIPRLSVLKEIPGANNIVSNGDRIDSSYARMQMEDRGFTVLNHRDHDYLRIYPAAGGKYHVTKFVDIELIGGQLLQTHNYDSLQEWRRSLVAEGHIDIPHPGMLKLVRKTAQDKRDRHAQKPHIPAEVDEMNRMDKLLEMMDIATENLIKKGLKSYDI